MKKTILEMVKKTYFLGKFKEGSDFEGDFLVGIRRQGQGTVPLSEDTPNGVKNEVTTRVVYNLGELRGYLMAVSGEFKFEGFDVDFKTWDATADVIFDRYLSDIPGFKGNIRGLNPTDLTGLSKIVGLHIDN